MTQTGTITCNRIIWY